MKRWMISTAIVCVVFSVFSQTAPGPYLQRPVKTEMVTRVTPGTAIIILDARVSDAISIKRCVEQIQDMSQVITKIQRQTELKGKNGLELAREFLKNKEIGAVVVLIDDGVGSPRFTVCPEDRMAVINAPRICADATPEKAGERLGKELFRAVAMISGGVDTGNYCVLKPVLANEDLDKMVAKTFSPPVAMNISQNALIFGFSKIECASYRVALLQGWAPSPTNELQRTIKEQVLKSLKDTKTNSLVVPKK
jgi:hypothetical protein